MKNIYLAIVIITYFFLVMYMVFYDYVSPRTPQSIIKVTLGIKIPRSVAIEKFYDNASFNIRTVSTGMVLRYNNDDKSRLVMQCQKNGFSQLPIAEHMPYYAIIQGYYNDSIQHTQNIQKENTYNNRVAGFYYYEEINRDYKIFVLDTLNNKIIYTYSVD